MHDELTLRNSSMSAEHPIFVVFCRACRHLAIVMVRPERCPYCSHMTLELAHHVTQTQRVIAADQSTHSAARDSR
jgi:hypothetical protein